MIKKIYLITLLVICSTAILFSQDRERRPREAKGIVYNKEMGGHLQLMTNGWSLGGHYGIMNTYYKTRIYSFEIGELKHVREERQSTGLGGGSFSNTSRSFIYGKQNNFYTVKFGMGEKRYFSEKADRKGVAVGMSYSFGPSLGLIKPYYLKENQPGFGNHVCNCGYMVPSKARGRGFATAMCEHSQKIAIDLGYKAMQFNLVVETNNGAIKLWKKLGFEIVGSLTKAFKSPTLGYVNALVMYKWLKI